MSLGDADLGGDSVLAEVAVEAQGEHEAVAIVERRQACAEQRPLLAALELGRARLGDVVPVGVQGEDVEAGSAAGSRGRRTGAARSRRCRRISPTIIGTA